VLERDVRVRRAWRGLFRRHGLLLGELLRRDVRLRSSGRKLLLRRRLLLRELVPVRRSAC
jgi:hypothetical protein